MIRGVGVEPLLDGAGRDTHRLAANGRFDRLKIAGIDCTGPYERFDFGEDLGLERRFEAPFLATSSEAASRTSSSASAHCSQARQ